MPDSNTPETQALEPCPHDGHEAKFERQQFCHPPKHWVKCTFCGASTDAYSSPDSARRAWNQRQRQSSSNAGGVDVGAIRRDEHRVRGSSAPNYCTPYGPAARALSAALDALKPFAEVADCYDDREDDNFEVWVDAGPERNIRASFKLAHYRKARAALASLSTPTAEPTPAQARRPIERAVALDLLHAVYAAEGWTRAEGESMVERVSTVYDVTSDPRRNRFIATPKDATLTTPPTPDRIGKDAVREGGRSSEGDNQKGQLSLSMKGGRTGRLEAALARVVDWHGERGADDQLLPPDAQPEWIADAMRALSATPDHIGDVNEMIATPAQEGKQ